MKTIVMMQFVSAVPLLLAIVLGSAMLRLIAGNLMAPRTRRLLGLLGTLVGGQLDRASAYLRQHNLYNRHPSLQRPLDRLEQLGAYSLSGLFTFYAFAILVLGAFAPSFLAWLAVVVTGLVFAAAAMLFLARGIELGDRLRRVQAQNPPRNPDDASR